MSLACAILFSGCRGTTQAVDDLLTTKQLQDLLKIDRITIYRMLGDGRLRGFKVGGQWRFPRREIEAWLDGQQGAPGRGPTASSVEGGALPSLSPSCTQAIQAVCAEALEAAVVVTDPQGLPLTTISNSCAFCDLVLSGDEGRRRCAAAWINQGHAQPCHAGLLCFAMPVTVGDEEVASIACCQFVTGPWPVDLDRLARELGLEVVALQAAMPSVKTADEGQLPRMERLLERAASALCAVGQERARVRARLSQIAEMTNL
jgi:excisionase family DNA binding protein